MMIKWQPADERVRRKEDPGEGTRGRIGLARGRKGPPKQENAFVERDTVNE